MQHAMAEMLKDFHIIVESLRNSFELLHQRLFGFLLTHLVCDLEVCSLEPVMEFWQLLGVEVEANMLESVACVNPWWKDGMLHVSAALPDETDKLEKVSGVLLYLFLWRKFTDSRFCTIGPSLRAVLASLAVGLSGLVAVTREDPKAFDSGQGHRKRFGSCSGEV